MMMMTRAAGGANLSAILENRHSGASRRVWTSILVLALAGHAGVAFYLYQSRFSLPEQENAPVPHTTVTLERPKITPPEPKPSAAQTPAPKLNMPKTVMPSEVPPLDVPLSPTTTTVIGPVINLNQPATTVEETPAPASEPSRAPSVITNPDWVQRPSGDQLMRAYPSRAIEAGVTGSAQLNCAVQVDGRLNDCRIVSETPARQGFGRAATSLSRYFRMSPRTVDGHAVEGARVTVGIRFDLTD